MWKVRIVLILVVMDDALALLTYGTFSQQIARVLILVVMDDALAHTILHMINKEKVVLILVVMDDALAHN